MSCTKISKSSLNEPTPICHYICILLDIISLSVTLLHCVQIQSDDKLVLLTFNISKTTAELVSPAILWSPILYWKCHNFLSSAHCNGSIKRDKSIQEYTQKFIASKSLTFKKINSEPTHHSPPKLLKHEQFFRHFKQ